MFDLITKAYALGPPPGGHGAETTASPLISFLPLVLIFAIFYFLLIRPQQKRAKQHRQFLENLKRGDEVMTSGGLIGRITGITDQVVTLEISDGTRVKVGKGHLIGPAPGKGSDGGDSSCSTGTCPLKK